MSYPTGKVLARKAGVLAFTLFSLAALNSAAGAQGVAAREDQGQWVVITGLGGDPACDAGHAQHVDIASLAQDGRRLRETCVSVAGILRGRTLIDSPHDARAYAMPDDRAHAGKRLGIYAAPDLRATFPADMSHVVLIGNVGDCDELSHREHVVMVSGYCHYATGTYIAVSTIRIAP